MHEKPQKSNACKLCKRQQCRRGETASRFSRKCKSWSRGVLEMLLLRTNFVESMVAWAVQIRRRQQNNSIGIVCKKPRQRQDVTKKNYVIKCGDWMDITIMM